MLFSVEGGRTSWTRPALAVLSYDLLHVFTPDPDHDDLQQLGAFVERAGATYEAEPVPTDDLMGAFETITAAMRRHDEAGSRACQVNAGPDANLLSAAGLMACLHEGVEAHFLDEAGHTHLPVLTRAPLARLLDKGQRRALLAFPHDGLHVAQVSDNDPKALQGLRDRGLIALEEGTLQLTPQGRAYRGHLERQGE